MQPAVGEKLAGRYRLVRLLGRGGMADVFAAEDDVLSRHVAVKVFRPGVDPTGSELRQQTEIRTLAALSHPRIVTVYDAGSEDGTAYVVMQLVEGRSLAEACGHGAAAPAEVARIGAMVAEALAHVHASRFIHRDVKPANVLLDRDGSAYLSDFGIVRLLDASRLTATGLVGTAAYLAPEQVRGQDVTPAADVYSLGLVLLECLTGQREYPGASVEAALARLSRQPRIPSDLPPAWQDLLAAMTAVAPEERPTAEQVAARLRLVAAPDTVPAADAGDAESTTALPTTHTRLLPTRTLRPPTAGHRTRPRALRSWGPMPVAALLVLLLLLGVVAAASAERGDRRSNRDAPSAPPGLERLPDDLDELREAVGR